MANVWRPQGTTARSNLPVMFFIHGGAWALGSGGSAENDNDDALAASGKTVAMYDGGKLSRAGVIMITINYRLAAFGFMRSSDGVGGGNGGLNGVNDMVVALQWTRDNIASFGGDPSQVTIFGESAGSLAVCILCVSPLAAGLFDKAIMES